MSVRCRYLAPSLISAAAAMVLLDTLYFASLRPTYSHLSNTISELGEAGAPQAHLVAFGFFLPVGLLVWLALWLTHCQTAGQNTSVVLLALSGLGAGYVLSAFFPCDPGAPLFGSWRTLVHNAAGLIDYGVPAVGFFLVSRRCIRNGAATQAAGFVVAGVSCWVCLVLLLPGFYIRGGVQRVTEAIQFTGVFFACLLLSKRLPPNKRPAPDAGTGRQFAIRKSEAGRQ